MVEFGPISHPSFSSRLCRREKKATAFDASALGGATVDHHTDNPNENLLSAFEKEAASSAPVSALFEKEYAR
jgi:hypothetical protein